MHYLQNNRAKSAPPILCLLVVGALQAGVTEAEIVDLTKRALHPSETLPNQTLKEHLQSCALGDFYPTDFSIAHRGAALGYPEHSREGCIAAAEQGAGVIDCDVTFTQGLALNCRHSQCDLATTKHSATPLAAKCSKPFRPANGHHPTSAPCCNTDISLAEFKTSCARPAHSNNQAKTVAQCLAPLRSPVVSAPCLQYLMTHAEIIELIDAFGRKFTPGFNQGAYADKLLVDYRAAGIAPSRAYPQSFNPDDIWLYAPIATAMTSEGQMLQALHVLANDVGARGVFADCPGTATYYVNCLMGLNRQN